MTLDLTTQTSKLCNVPEPYFGVITKWLTHYEVDIARIERVIWYGARLTLLIGEMHEGSGLPENWFRSVEDNRIFIDDCREINLPDGWHTYVPTNAVAYVQFSNGYGWFILRCWWDYGTDQEYTLMEVVQQEV